jgi:hypothetical protein
MRRLNRMPVIALSRSPPLNHARAALAPPTEIDGRSGLSKKKLMACFRGFLHDREIDLHRCASRAAARFIGIETGTA